MRALVDSALCSTELCYSLTFTLNCACLKHVLGVMMKWVGRRIIFGFKFRFCCPETLRGFLLITLEHNLESSLIICLSVSLLHTHIHSPPSRPPQVQAGSFLSCPCRQCIPGLPECPINTGLFPARVQSRLKNKRKRVNKTEAKNVTFVTNKV